MRTERDGNGRKGKGREFGVLLRLMGAFLCNC